MVGIKFNVQNFIYVRLKLILKGHQNEDWWFIIKKKKTCMMYEFGFQIYKKKGTCLMVSKPV